MSKWINDYEQRLSGGHPNSLGETIEVAIEVSRDETQQKFDQLCQCYSSSDEVVRLRVSSVLKRICGWSSNPKDNQGVTARPDWIIERFGWLIDDVGAIEQPSAKWTIAQIILELDDSLSSSQRRKAATLLKTNLENEPDWIVQNFTAEALAQISLKYNDAQLQNWLESRLKKMSRDKRKSVAARAQKLLKALEESGGER